MSTFVEIDPSEYDGAAFARFDAKADDFKIANARALMWLSQLAYEAHRKETIEEVAPEMESHVRHRLHQTQDWPEEQL